jgi:hypothetical protein
MNRSFEENQYLIVENFFSEKECENLYNEYIQFLEREKIDAKKVDSIVNIATQAPSCAMFVEKLCMIYPRVVEIVKENLLPTYALGRIYTNGSILRKHVDRPACEISLTVNLAQDKEWAIWLNSNGTPRQVIQKPGDALFYLGCDAEHWREPYDGSMYCQVFFHYVRSRGKRAQHYFDKMMMNCINPEKVLKF